MAAPNQSPDTQGTNSPQGETSSDSGRPEGISLSTALFNVLLFVLAFGAGAYYLRQTLPDTSGLITETKIDHYRKHREEYDLIFLGSSRTYRGFMPEVFDAILAEEGFPLKSYNFGVLGNRVAETHEVLKEIKAFQPQRLKYVLLDPEPVGLMAREEFAVTRRLIDWHDPGLSWDVARLLWNTELEWPDQLKRQQFNWTCFAYNGLNIGRGEPISRELVGRGWDWAQHRAALGPRMDGFQPHLPSLVERSANNPGEAKLTENYLAQVEAMRSWTVPKAQVGEHKLRFLQRLDRMISSLGAKPHWVVMPTVVNRTEMLRAKQHEDIDELLYYADPDKYESFYLPEYWYDSAHANAAGARVITEVLARDFAQYLRDQSEQSAE